MQAVVFCFLLSIAIATTVVVHGQQPIASPQEIGPRFDVASVKPNVGSDLSIPFRAPPADGIVLTNNPLESIIRYAFEVQPFRLVGAPDWTRRERFDIAGKAASAISDQQRRQMMRALLIDRFQLKAHVELRDRTIGIIGFGGIGRELARLLAPFGVARVLVFDPYTDPAALRERGVQI